MTELLILTKTETKTITIDTEPYEPLQLTPRIARKAAVLSKSIPCLVTNGFVCYRVTTGWVVIKPIEELKHKIVLQIINWLTEANLQ